MMGIGVCRTGPLIPSNERCIVMASFSWINIKKEPAYKDAVAEIEKMILAKTRPLEASLAEAGQAVTKLEKEVAELKARLT